MKNVWKGSGCFVDLTEQEMVKTCGGFGIGEALARMLVSYMGVHMDDIIKSAQGTKRTFAAHPEIFVK